MRQPNTFMIFKKILVAGFEKSEINQTYLEKMNMLTEKIIFLSKDSPEIKNELKDTDCLLVKFNPVSREWIDLAPKLKYIGAFATGYGKIDIEYAKSKQITVCNVPDYSTESVAEFVFAITLEQLRELERAKKQTKNKNYSEDGFLPTEIKGKTFGILGLGNIGKRVSEIALCFGADVRYWSRNRKEDFEIKGVKYEDADHLISESDFLSVHFSHTKDTENFLNKDRIQKIKKNAIIINTAPMELVDIDALEIRLKAGDLTFILDHSDEMTNNTLERLSRYNNCIIYPPMGCITKEAGINKQEIFIKNMENFLQESPTNKIN